MNRFTLWIWLVIYACVAALYGVSPRLLAVAVASVGAAFLLHWLTNREFEETREYM